MKVTIKRNGTAPDEEWEGATAVVSEHGWFHVIDRTPDGTTTWSYPSEAVFEVITIDPEDTA